MYDKIPDDSSSIINIDNKLILDTYAKLKSSDYYDYNGWLDTSLMIKQFNQADKVASKMKSISNLLVVVGIGGSYLGSKAITMSYLPSISIPHQVDYLGSSLDSDEVASKMSKYDLFEVSVHIVSKSGSTLETTLISNLMIDYMMKRYPKDYTNRIVVTTERGSSLHNKAISNNYLTLDMPKNIGGRYSVHTTANLVSIMYTNPSESTFSLGYLDAIDELDNRDDSHLMITELVNYINHRWSAYSDQGKLVEALITSSTRLDQFVEWWKQLVAESDGKDNSGILPIGLLYSRDLHSLGQYIDDGHQVLFETYLSTNPTSKQYASLELYNELIINSAKQAHSSIGVPTYSLSIMDNINPYLLGKTMLFFMVSTAIFSILRGVNPFDQPGVEVYKSIMRGKLNEVNALRRDNVRRDLIND